MKASKRIITYLMFSALPLSSAALSPAEKEAIDSYIRAKSQMANEMNPIFSGIVAEANTCLTNAENISRTEIPEIGERAKSLQRDIALLDDNAKYVSSVDFNVYNDPKWLKEMRVEATRFCCTLRAKPVVAKRFNMRLKNGAVAPSPSYNEKFMKEKGRPKRFGIGRQ